MKTLPVLAISFLTLSSLAAGAQAAPSIQAITTGLRSTMAQSQSLFAGPGPQHSLTIPRANQEKMNRRFNSLLRRRGSLRSPALPLVTRTGYLATPHAFASPKLDNANCNDNRRIDPLPGGNGGAATAANLYYPEGVAVDSGGNFYISDDGNCQIRRVNISTGIIGVAVGTGQCGYAGDGQLGVNAQLNYPGGIAIDSTGNLYIADSNNSVIRKVDAVTGIIRTVAGDGTYGNSSDGVAATATELGYPVDVAVDGSGNLYIADSDTSVIRKVDGLTGIITTVAATVGKLIYPDGVAVDVQGNLYISDEDNAVVYVVLASTGLISTYAGNGTSGYLGDGGSAPQAELACPAGLRLDSSGDLYIADQCNSNVRMVDSSTGIISTVAGIGTEGFAGDGGAATDAELDSPYAVAVDTNGNLYIADLGENRIRQVDSSGFITTVAGNGLINSLDNGAPANAVPLFLGYQNGIALDSSGNIYFAEPGNNAIREILAANGTIVMVAGNGIAGYVGDGGASVNSELNDPAGIALDQYGNLYIADTDNAVVRRVDHGTGIIATVAGNGAYDSNSGDGGLATSTSVEYPSAIALDSSGNLYIAQTYTNTVRKVDSQGIITTVAGNGQLGNAGNGGDGGPATSAALGYPDALAVDTQGNLYIGSEFTPVVRRVDASTGIITTVAGNGQYGDSGDGGPAVNAALGDIVGLSFDSAGDLYIADHGSIRVVNTGGVIDTLAGQGGTGYSGDGGAVASAEVSPVGVAVDSASNVYFADFAANRIRKISTGTPQADAAMPAITPGAGSYGSSQTVMLSDSTAGSQIFFTLDGSLPDPGTASLYTSPISLIGSVSVAAIAIAPGYSTSSNTSATYSFPSAAPSAPFAPALTPPGGAYIAAQTVTLIDATSGATIYYTADGSLPTAASTVYSGPITVSATDTIRAVAVASSLNSSVADGSYVITLPSVTTLTSTANPVFLGVNITFTAAVTSPVAGIPTGSVSFSVDGGAPVVESLNGAAQATFSASNLAEGQHAIVANYLGDANFPASSGTLTQTVTTGLQFISITPCRVADTRGAAGPFGAPELGAGTNREFDLPQSGCGIPSTAIAYSLNVTAVPDQILQYLTLWPSGTPQPYVSTLNSYDGRIKANAAITPAGANGGVNVFVSDASNVILDVDGYFASLGTNSALSFYPLTPCRVADTRSGSGALGGPFLSGQTSRSFPVQSTCGIPATAQAYSLNVTAVPHTTLNYLTTWPTGGSQPNVSTLNAPTGAVTANAAIVPAGSGGAVSLFVSDDADIILDVNGYFAAPASNGLSLYTVTPCRVVDTRSSIGLFSGVLQVPVETSACALPPEAEAYVLNATVVPPGPLSYLTLWPDGQAQPDVSTLNAGDAAITSNMAIVPTTNGQVDTFSSNPTQVIFDINSYFAP